MNNAQQRPTTTDAGIPVPSDEHSLTIGPDGPILLQDHYLLEQMANFNRERIAERQPHAKGSGAFGHFEVTNDVAPNSYGGPEANPDRAAEVHWYTDGDMVRSAYTLRSHDDDWGQAHTLVRAVMDGAARERLVSNVVGHLRGGVSKEVLSRTFEYWKNIDKEVGDNIEAAVRNGSA